MNITLLTCSNGRSRSLSLHSNHHFAALGVAVTVVLGLAMYSGYHVGQVHQTEGMFASWKEQIAEQERELMDVRENTRAEVAALSDRLAKLQGRVSRIDAMGRRLVDVTDLDADEFDFDSLAGIGGPLIRASAARGAGLDDLASEVGALAALVEDRERKYRVLEGLMVDRELQAETTPAGWPVSRGWISSAFGHRTDPLTGRRAWHGGVDFAARHGTSIYAVAGGVVTFSGRHGAYGNMVDINHGNGYTTRYAHNEENLVRVGEVVRSGDEIARVGSTGRSTGPHVHLEVRKDGEPVNPAPFASAER